MITTKRMHDVNQIAEYFANYMREELNRMTKTCITCEHWCDMRAGQPAEICGKFDARPPARVIAYGCDHWQEAIPF